MKTSKDLIELFISEAPKLKTTVSSDFGVLNEDQLNRKPSPDKWSIGECIDHLIVSHDQYLKKIRNVNVEGFARGEDDRAYKHTIFGKLLVDSVSPQSSERKRPPKYFIQHIN